MAVGEDDLEKVHQLPMFRGLAADALRSVVKDAEVLAYSKRTTIFEQGDPVTHFFGVLSGWVKLYRLRPDGSEVIIEVFGPGESFAEGAICMPDGYPVSAEMVERGRLLAVPVTDYIDRLREDPDMVLRTFASLAVNLKRLVTRIETASSQTSSQRVGAFLLHFCSPSRPYGSAVDVRLPYDKKLIANRLGMKPETFSRALAQLRNHGVTIKGGDARIADLAVLHRHVSPE
ncbi:MAG: Crp/Fnr family transcriptional regulator [Alphaproteobacteria bacterium]|nr:Crp/Fnr family transcriptional regulator [Alphaproteobacteria bacterium]MYE59582.1 Crp/Fnr family transcriptional regulator [Alphaproteobacteria bacterium]